MSSGGNETRTQDPAPQHGAGSTHVLVIDDTSSRRIEIPADGALHIGRSSDAEIQIASEVASRVHAKLMMVGGRAYVVDLDSHNGTFLNDERIEGAQPLVSGDVIAIANALLIVRSASPNGVAEPLSLDQMTFRIDQEIARATDYDRPFSVVIVRPELDPQTARNAMTAALRAMDVVGSHGHTAIALLPELDSQAAEPQARILVEAGGPSSVGGLASYPVDGCDSATLLAAARRSLAAATAGNLVVASTAAIDHHIGTKRVRVADPAMIRLYDLVRRLARSDLAVLITGETGSGKENAAAAVHHWSPRAAGPFVALNCAAVPDTLAESELFGHERGAFSDARATKPGLFERAHGGTLFLDEIGDLSLTLQAKVLRALESKRIRRLGDSNEREVDVRVVAATNVDLDAAVAQHRFRQDLLFRLGAATVSIPPLRHRRQEISLLARMFVELECERLSRAKLEISEGALAALARYDFPGNVRELKNAIDFAVATTDGITIHVHDLPGRITGTPRDNSDSEPPRPRFRPLADELRELERRRIVEALDAHDGVQTRAAAAIGMPLRTFTFRMRQYGVESRHRSR